MGQSITRRYAFMPPAPSYTASLPNVWIARAPPATGRIPALFVDAGAGGAPPRRVPVTVLYAHGNAEDLGHTRARLVRLSAAARVAVLAFDYPGYGLNTGEAPTEAGVVRDAAAAFAYLVRARGVDPRSIVLMGRSIGSGPAVALAAQLCRAPCPALGCGAAAGLLGGLLVESGVASCVRVVSAAAAHVPYTDVFPNVDRIGAVTAPVCIVHGARDTTVPVAHAHMLWAATRPAARWRLLILPAAGHDDIPAVAPAEWLAAIIDLADTVEHRLAPESPFLPRITSRDDSLSTSQDTLTPSSSPLSTASTTTPTPQPPPTTATTTEEDYGKNDKRQHEQQQQQQPPPSPPPPQQEPQPQPH